MNRPPLDTPLHINTPLIRSQSFDMPMATVWLKMEALQPSGSFKNRGIGVACQHYVRAGAELLISSSGGNAGIATAYCGAALAIPVYVVVPENAPQTAIDAMRKFGAQVEVSGSTWIEAHSKALALVEENAKKQAVLIHPFDDPLLWPGHATMIDEIVASGCKPDAVVLSVGGGGLLTGVCQGLKRNGLNNCEVAAVETHGAASFAAAVSAGEPVMLETIDTIANTLGAKQVANAAFAVTNEFTITSHLVSDRQALDACKQFLDDHRILVEPACGATLAAAYQGIPTLAEKKNILLIVCGGMGVSLQQLANWDKQLPKGGA